MERRRSGFTLIELLVVIAIIAILAAILFPVFMTAKEKARQTTCLNNLKQLGNGFRMYVDDWGAYPGGCPLHRYPPGTNPYGPGKTIGEWVAIDVYQVRMAPERGVIFPYVRSVKVYVCPSDASEKKRDFRLSYSMNAAFDPDYNALTLGSWTPVTDAQVVGASKTVLLLCEGGGDPNPIIDGYFGYVGNGGRDRPTYIHCGGTNYAFADGHATWTRRKGEKNLKWVPYP